MTEVALVLSICAFAMAFLAIARAGSGRPAALTELRLLRLERRLQEVAGFVGAPAPAEPAPSTVGRPSQEVLDLVAAGRKIEAIKQYRTETGVGLKAAKDAVEAAAAAGDGQSELNIHA